LFFAKYLAFYENLIIFNAILKIELEQKNFKMDQIYSEFLAIIISYFVMSVYNKMIKIKMTEREIYLKYSSLVKFLLIIVFINH
jgi:hypothetical protein